MRAFLPHPSPKESTAVLNAGLVNYLLQPSPHAAREPRSATAIVILVLYFLLLIPVVVCYFRLLQTIIINPGYVPRGPQWHKGLRQQGLQLGPRRTARSRRPSAVPQEKSGHPNSNQAIESGGLIGRDYDQTTVPFQGSDMTALQNGLEEVWTRDAFVCDAEGRPIFCSTCLNYKPDRAHHCKEVGRCVRKMDHYCPW